jgi:hypothetical protein
MEGSKEERKRERKKERKKDKKKGKRKKLTVFLKFDENNLYFKILWFIHGKFAERK